MRRLAAIRRVVPWVLGLYLVAQISGVALLAVHFHHAYQSQIAAADDIALTGAVDRDHEHNGHHQHGAADPGDQCCTLHHHLTAVLFFEPAADVVGFVSTALLLTLPDVLVGAEPGLLDRPPKLLLSV